LRVKTDQWHGLIRLQKNDNDRQLIVASVSLDGAVKDQLELSG